MTVARNVIVDVVLDLAEHFADLDDTEDPPFGEYARVARDADAGTVTVLHASEPWGVEIRVTPVMTS